MPQNTDKMEDRIRKALKRGKVYEILPCTKEYREKLLPKLIKQLTALFKEKIRREKEKWNDEAIKHMTKEIKGIENIAKGDIAKLQSEKNDLVEEMNNRGKVCHSYYKTILDDKNIIEKLKKENEELRKLGKMKCDSFGDYGKYDNCEENVENLISTHKNINCKICKILKEGQC